MPLFMDIYALSRRTDIPTIKRFIYEYACQEIADQLRNHEIYSEGYIFRSDSEQDFSYIIDYGLPREGFYLAMETNQNFSGAYFGCTHDDLLLIGAYVEDAMILPENLPRGKEILRRLMQDYDCHWGIIMSGQEPPMSEADFEEWEQHPMTDCVMKRVKDRIEVTYERERKPEEFIG
jgi:hypothetical protein